MPAELCPRCGTARTAAGCACSSSDPSVADTAVLPHVEGPPLVRPYVAATTVEQPPAPAYDPFATSLTPPAPGRPAQPPQAPARPPYPQQVPAQQAQPQFTAPAGPAQQPHQSLAATTVLPTVPAQAGPAQAGPAQQGPGRPGPLTLGPVAAGPVADAPTAPPAPPIPAGPPGFAPAPAAPHHAWDPAGGEGWGQPADEPWAAEHDPDGDLGMFTFRDENTPPLGSRSERRSQQQESANRRRLVIVGAAVGLAAVGAGLALALTPSSSDRPDRALPAPTGTAVPSPTDPSPSGEPTSASATASASPSPSRTVKPTSKAPAAPVTTAAPTTATPTSAPPTTASPSASVTVLRVGDKGPDVRQMKQLLYTAYCGQPGRRFASDDRFDQATYTWVADFQWQMHITKDQQGEYGAATRAALEAEAANPGC